MSTICWIGETFAIHFHGRMITFPFLYAVRGDSMYFAGLATDLRHVVDARKRPPG